MTIFIFLFFTALVGGITWFLTRKDDHGTSTGYFLAGRSLTGGYIAGSLLLTNLSTEQLVGLNGAAFNDGIAVMAWEVIAGKDPVFARLKEVVFEADIPTHSAYYFPNWPAVHKAYSDVVIEAVSGDREEN